jgi:hypothetical protein
VPVVSTSFWSAAMLRRFQFFLFFGVRRFTAALPFSPFAAPRPGKRRKKQSGGKSPHSKKNENVAG